ncbi:MAG TPA: hemin receptor [Flavobacteriia bacterium]|nr:hemin receptor [Flavobacteriia bacterium]
MKKFFILLGGWLLSSLAINAQSIPFTDAAVLFSGGGNNGTARFNAMSGAFGALGGDMSAGDVNPAGLAIFKNSSASVTFGLRNTDINTSFHGTNVSNNDNYFNITQAGGVMVFDNSGSPYWKKIALGFNYSLARDFENNYIVRGNSGISEFNSDPFLNNDSDPNNDIFYNNVDGQFFGNTTNGQNEKFTFSLAAQYNEKFYLGFSVVAHSLDFFQNALFEESNNDGNGNLLDASLLQQLNTFGEGVGFSLGFIAKPTQEVRFGVAYETPVWYNLTDQFAEDLEIQVSNDNQLFVETQDISVFDYKLTTPSRLTGSFAYIIGKEGLISFDYTYKNYTNTKLKPNNDFVNENEFFTNGLKNTSTFNVGAEWRLDNVSLRGGYHYEQTPFEDSIDSDNINGYSFGIGFKFKGNIKLDLAYQNSTNTDVYRFLDLDGVEPAELDITNDKFTATLVIGL